MRQKLINEIQNLVEYICTDDMPARVVGIYGYGDFLTNELATRADLIVRYAGGDKPNETFLKYVDWINQWKDSHDATPLSVLKKYPSKLPTSIALWISKCTWEDLAPKRLDTKIRFGHNDQIFRLMATPGNSLWSSNPTVSIQSWIPESLPVRNNCKLIWSAANRNIEKNLCSKSIEILGIREMQELINLSQRNSYMAACISALRVSKKHHPERLQELVEKSIANMPPIQDTLCDLPDSILKTLSMFGMQEISALKIVLKEAKIRLMVQPYFLRAMVRCYLAAETDKSITINQALSEVPECGLIPRSGLYLAVKPFVDYMNTGNEDHLDLVKIGHFTVRVRG